MQFGLERQQVCQSSVTTQTSPTTGGHHLALLYHSSHHHHHHHSVQPQLPSSMRRPSRLPPAIYTRPPEIKAYVINSFLWIFSIEYNYSHSFQLNHHIFMSRYQMFATTLSALYGKLLVVLGIAFPMAEVISTYIPPSFYEVHLQHFLLFV